MKHNFTDYFSPKGSRKLRGFSGALVRINLEVNERFARFNRP